MTDRTESNPSLDSKKTENAATLAWAQRWLSAPRLEPYLTACDDDIDRALELHEWNVGLGQVLMADIAHFEVALRNAYDRVMRERWNGEHWLLDDESPVLRPIIRTSKNKKRRDVNLVTRRTVAEARGNAHDGNNPDQVVANLMLGFWTHLTDRSRERDLWIPYLNTAWPKGTDRNELNRALASINRVRNRVAHNERLFNSLDDSRSPTAVDAAIFRALGVLCPDAFERLYGSSEQTSVERYVREHPAPANVKL